MKKRELIVLGIVILILEIVIIIIGYSKIENNNISEKYVAVFKGESSEVVHSTYIYKVKKKKKVIYKYVNTISTINGYDSTDWTEKVIKKGKTKKLNKIYEIAQDNDAFSYVKSMKDDKIYTIEEFRNIFK